MNNKGIYIDNTNNVERMQKEIRLYAGQLARYIDVERLRAAAREYRRAERMYGYHEVLRDACCGCFRGTGSGNALKVYGHNGKIWVPVQAEVFKDVVGEAAIKSAGDYGHVIKGDWNNGSSKMYESARSGVAASPLEVSGSVVAFRNGVWDFSDVENPVRYEFKDRMPVVSMLEYDYDPDAVCPRWVSFLNMMLGKKEVELLQKFLGLGVVRRRDMRHRVEESLWLVGNGANGKSTIGNVLHAVYGENNISNMSLGQMLDRQSVMRLMAMAALNGKLFNWTDEVDISDISQGSDAFKKLCSGEAQAMRGIRENFSEARDIPFLIFSMNQMPSNKRMDEAFRRRVVRIDFNATINEEDMDRELLTKLLEELSGIRNWMMEGYKKLVADKFMFKHSNNESYMEQNGQFFDIFCKKYGLRAAAWAGRKDEPRKVLFATLREAYLSFCKRRMYDAGVDTEVNTRLGKDLKRLGFKDGRSGQGKWYVIYCDKWPDWILNG